MLFCNAAVTRRFKYNDINKEMTPYTISQAHDYGWIFKIPVTDRIGSGLLYNSNLVTKEQAEKALIKHWGKDRVEDSTAKFNHISFKPVYNRNTWKSNVISIGVSNGFAEPLESSSIHLTTDVIEHLTGRIRKGFYTEHDINILNNRITQKFEETYDFIGLHYLNNKRDSIFWNYVRDNIKITESLKFRIQNYKQYGIHDWDMDEGIVFAPHSWFTMYESLNFCNSVVLNKPLQKPASYLLDKKFNITNYECLNV
jgi:tryptophan halogenase